MPINWGMVEQVLVHECNVILLFYKKWWADEFQKILERFSWTDAEWSKKNQNTILSNSHIVQRGQLGGAVDRAPVEESGGPEFKSHLRHLILTRCVTLGKSLNPSYLILGHLQSSWWISDHWIQKALEEKWGWWPAQPSLTQNRVKCKSCHHFSDDVVFFGNEGQAHRIHSMFDAS